MALWDPFLTDQDRQIFSKAGYGTRMGFGKRPAVLIIDVNRNFCGGEGPVPILESLETYRNSCGEIAWEAIPKIATLLETARAHKIPVFYSTSAPSNSLFERGRWADKNPRNAEEVGDAKGHEIVAPLKPQAGELVIEKSKPSVFFGTILASYLVDLNIDTIIACGTTTSGCVRATVIDAFSLNYRVTVVEDCTFDRGEASHAINLFDLSQKYADVLPLKEVLPYLSQFPSAVD